MPASLFRRILVPHDFSPQATVALKTAAHLAREHDGTLTVLHVVVPFYIPADVPFGFAADAMPSPTQFVPEQRKRLESLVNEGARHGRAARHLSRRRRGRVAVHPRRGAAAPTRSS